MTPNEVIDWMGVAGIAGLIFAAGWCFYKALR